MTIFSKHFLSSLLGVLLAASVYAAPPNLNHQSVVVDPANLGEDLTGEIIFPSLLRVADHVANPLGNYYLYFAPHDAPGDIKVAYADNIEGPYTEYAGNPLIDNSGQGKLGVSAVTHVSSPNVVWMEQYNKYFLYFHGENNTTRWAWSTDGLNWTIANDNIAVTAADFNAAFGSGFTETSYARVFEYSIPTWGDRYTMVLMVNHNNTRSIALATSNDGKHFTPRDGALISPGPDGQSHISGAFYWQDAGKHYVLYHGASNIYYTEVGANFDQEIHRGVFYDPADIGPEYNKAAEPFLHYENGQWHMFYSVGPRLSQKIGYANESDPPPTADLGIVVDNDSADFLRSSSGWLSSNSTYGYWGTDYLVDENAGTDADVWAVWQPTLPASGEYQVYARWSAHSNRPDAVLYRVYHQGQVTEVWKNQTINGNRWQSLGSYWFDANDQANNRVSIDAASDLGRTIADSVRFVPVD